MAAITSWQLLVSICASYIVVLARATDYYFENYCTGNINIGDGGGEIESGTSWLSTQYAENLDCTVTLTTTANRRILITWYRFDVEETFSTCGDTLTIYNGNTATGTPLNTNKCGWYLSSSLEYRYSSVTSTGNTMTFRLITDSSDDSNDFKMIYTSFTEDATCGTGEEKCNNGRCIDSALFDDFNDNCGDGSDTDWADLAAAIGGLFALGFGIVIAVVVGSIVGGILLCVCCGCLCYHLCCKKQPANQVTVVHAAPPPGNGMQMQQMQGPGPV